MLQIFKKKKVQNVIQSPVGGKCIDICNVSDPVFADKIMGDGVAVIPTTHIVKAPCDGILTMLFPTKHAFGIKTTTGEEILIHIGVDTVNLNGSGFHSYKQVNDKVKAGESIVSFDEKYIKNKEIDMTTMVIITSGEAYVKQRIGQDVNSGEELLKKRE